MQSSFGGTSPQKKRNGLARLDEAQQQPMMCCQVFYSGFGVWIPTRPAKNNTTHTLVWVWVVVWQGGTPQGMARGGREVGGPR